MDTNNIQAVEVFVLSRIGQFNEDWVRVYLEPNNMYSDCGGRITVNIGDDIVGSYFFSHCGGDSFKSFIGQCYPGYLIGKLFKTKSSVELEDGDEVINFVFNNADLKATIKEQRATGELSKEQLRTLYNNFKDCEFGGPGQVSAQMNQSEFDVANQVFGDDWYFGDLFCKSNPAYQRQEIALQAVIDKCRNKS